MLTNSSDDFPQQKMSSRSRRVRGRPPKTPSLSTRSNFLKKPKAYCGWDSDSRASTPVSSGSSTSLGPSWLKSRGSSRQAARKSRSFIHRVLNNTNSYDDDDDDFADRDDPKFDKDADFDVDHRSDAGDLNDDDEEENDSESNWSEASYSTFGSGRRRYVPRREKTPELHDDKDIPPLILPDSSTDLMISNEHSMKVLGIYEVLRHFRTILRISPFIFEDFCIALSREEPCTLLTELHIALLKVMMREEDGNNTTFGSNDTKDSINITFHFLDHMTWFELIRSYLDAGRTVEYRSALPALEKSDYSVTTVAERLQILQSLTDVFLGTNVVREEIMNEGNIHYDDHCRCCHR